MEAVKILLAAIVGTILMTAFSYLMSEAFHKLFKEPVLLNKLLQRLGVKLPHGQLSIVGWLIHFVIGLLFAFLYELFWKYTDADPTWGCGLILGAISGIVGILAWMIMFRLPESPPKVKFSEYYLQLFFAHIVFALGVIAVYKIYPQ